MIANANGLLAAFEISTMTGKNDHRTAAESILPAALNSFLFENAEDGGGVLASIYDTRFNLAHALQLVKPFREIFHHV